MKAQDAGEKFWKSFGLVSAEKDEEIRRLKEKISQMENTKVWKLYRSIKKNKLSERNDRKRSDGKFRPSDQTE